MGRIWTPGRCSLFFASAALELVVVVLLLVVVVFTRLLGLEPIEMGGDAITVWEFARDLLHGSGLPEKFNHHTSRFALVLPTLIAQWVWGSGPTTYFIGPIGASLLLHLFVYLIGRKVSGPLAGLVATVGLLFFDPMVRASSQILPEAYGPMYTCGAVWAALEFSDARRDSVRRGWLALAGVAVVGAYGSKMSYLYFAPTVALIVWQATNTKRQKSEPLPHRENKGAIASFFHRSWRRTRRSGLLTPAMLGLALLAVVTVEWIFFATVTENQTGGRLSVVTGSHSAKGAIDSHQLHKVGDFFALYSRAPTRWIQALAMGAFALLGVGAFARDRRARQLALGFFIYFLLQTFVLRSFSPPIPWMEPHPRYLIALAAPIALMIGIFANDALGALGSCPRGERRGVGLPLRLVSLLISVAVLLNLGSSLSEDWERSWQKKDHWNKTEALGEKLTAAFKAGIPIVSDTPRGKPARAALSVYIDPSELLVDGQYSRKSFFRKLDGGAYVASALGFSKIKRKHLDNAVRRRLGTRRCIVRLRQRHRGMTGRTKFSKTCESLRLQFEEDPKAGRVYKKPTLKKRKRKKTRR